MNSLIIDNTIDLETLITNSISNYNILQHNKQNKWNHPQHFSQNMVVKTQADTTFYQVKKKKTNKHNNNTKNNTRT